jgi:hypothetical protein
MMRPLSRPWNKGGAALTGEGVEDLALVLLVWTPERFCDLLGLDQNGARLHTHAGLSEFDVLEAGECGCGHWGRLLRAVRVSMRGVVGPMAHGQSRKGLANALTCVPVSCCPQRSTR